MGQCVSKTPEDQQSHQIDVYLRSDRRQRSSIKLLLLGPGGSGKSTIFKQAKIIFGDGFQADEERRPYIEPLHANALEALKKLVDIATTDQTIQLNKATQENAVKLLRLPLRQHIDEEIGSLMMSLWRDKAIQSVASQGAEFTVSDSTQYLLDRLSAMCQRSYIPSMEDIVRCRVRTSGIVEQDIRIRKVTFRFVDVGGQRGERRKWIHCFDNVQALVYVAAISEYDQTLLEDPTVNRLSETLQLFEDVVRLPEFQRTPTLVFLNKCDILHAKLKRKQGNLQSLFPEYAGGYNFDNAVAFLIDKFQEKLDANTCVHPTQQPAFTTSNTNTHHNHNHNQNQNNSTPPSSNSFGATPTSVPSPSRSTISNHNSTHHSSHSYNPASSTSFHGSIAGGGVVNDLRDDEDSVIEDEDLRPIYFHVTNATSQDNMTFVFQAVYDIIVRQNLRQCELT